MLFAYGFQFGVALHEIGHAIGYLHEQDRSDRDRYVVMHPENAGPSKLTLEDI